MPLLRRTHERRRNIRARRTAPKLQGRRRQDRHVMTAAPIPALAHDHDHDSPRGRGGMFPLTPPRPPQPKRFSVDPSPGLPPSIRPRRSPRTCPTTPTTPADFRAPPNARPSNPHRPSPPRRRYLSGPRFPPSEAFRRRPFSPRPRFCVGPASETLNDSSRPECANSGHVWTYMDPARLQRVWQRLVARSQLLTYIRLPDAA